MERANRYNTGKPSWSLVDFKSLEPMVKVLEYGAIKYTPDNWKKGLPTLETCESLLRHTFAFMNGEDADPESGLDHLGHMMCNVMFLVYMMKNKPEFDNRLKDVHKTRENSQIDSIAEHLCPVYEAVRESESRRDCKEDSTN